MKFKAKVVVPIVAVLAVGIGIAVYFLRPAPDDGRIPYATGVVVTDETDIEPADFGWLDLLYDYQARSSDGVNFSCMLANAASNRYDMYFDLYTDAELTDEVFLSGLLKPGTALEEITLDHALPAGTNTVYVAMNQVDTDEDGKQTIVDQTVVTVEFIVSE